MSFDPIWIDPDPPCRFVAVSDDHGDWTGRIDGMADGFEGQPVVVCIDPGGNEYRYHGMRVVCTYSQLMLVDDLAKVPGVMWESVTPDLRAAVTL